MKKLILILLILGCAYSAFGQNPTAVTGTITDPNGIVYFPATVTATLTPTTLNPTANGQAINPNPGTPYTVSAATNSNGSFSLSLYPNSAITPAATQYVVTVQASGSAPPAGLGPKSFSVTVTISGSSQSLTTTLNAAAVALLPTSTGGATPSGPAGGDLAGTYPNPTIATTGSTAASCGDATHSCSLTVNTKGQITANSNNAITGVTTNQNIREINALFDGGGSALSGTSTRCRVVNFGGTIQGISLLADVSGSATVKVLTVAYASYTGPASGVDISNGGEALSTAVKLQDTTLTSWTTALTAGTVVCVQVSSPSTLTNLSASLKVAAN